MSQRDLGHGTTAYIPDPIPGGGYTNAADEWARDTGGTYTVGPDGQVYAYQAPNFWIDKFLPIAIAAGFGAGPFLQGLGAAGAAGSAGASAGASSAPMTAQQMYDAGMFAGPTNMAASNMAGALAPAGAGAGAGAAAAGAAGASAAGLANGSSLLKDILTKYAPLGLAGLSAVKGFQQPAATGDLNDVIGLAKNRVQQSEPLFQALNRMAMSGLPNYAK